MCAYSLSETAMDDTPLPTAPVTPEHSDDDDDVYMSPLPHSHQPTPLHHARTFFSSKPALVSSPPQSLFTPPTTPPPFISMTPESLTTSAGLLPPLQVECAVRARIPTMEGGEFFLHLYKNNRDGKEHLALVWGDDLRSRSLDAPRLGETEMDRVMRGAYKGRLRQIVTGGGMPLKGVRHVMQEQQAQLPASIQPPLVRIHSECYTGEVVHSGRCDCGEQLDEAMRLVQREGRGVIVYLRQEGRNIGLLDKLKSDRSLYHLYDFRAYNLQDLGYDTVSANVMLHHAPDERTYDVATAILADLGLSQIRLLTNNPDKIEQIEGDGIVRVVERVPMVPRVWAEQGQQGRDQKELHKYLKVKVERMRHIMEVPRNLLTGVSGLAVGG
ncbi:GTP cyclohydrolase II-domain-containing protein [Endogone sp. FLAS-F59071]|nr:GTP cyclohydrolase II-domain-containing protein [Endogone sp. FLAS-F59071]|eukprot:RUS13659.1 GTP cyclohydrolase II-domain-containing protein [Endogone sp. FLAS-F59071]